MCLRATKPSPLSLDSPNNSETWALKKVQEKGAPSNLDSPNNTFCEAKPRAAHEATSALRANSFHVDAKSHEAPPFYR